MLRPHSLTLLASYWAFFFRRHALDTHDGIQHITLKQTKLHARRSHVCRAGRAKKRACWSPGRQLVLLFAGARPGGEGQLADGRQVADHLVELPELRADLQQLPGVGRQVLHVCTTRLLQSVLPCSSSQSHKHPSHFLTPSLSGFFFRTEKKLVVDIV